MKSRALWRISVATTPEAEEAVAEIMSETLGQPATSYSDAETGRTVVTVFLEPTFSIKSKSHATEDELRSRLRPGLARVAGCGLSIGPGRITVSKVRPQDWAESWKRHFKPISVGGMLLVKPSWSRRRPREGQKVVTLDPGLSFGTGQHPTTSFCLRQLALRRRSEQKQSFFDIGTGSGILAIAAAKLGYAPVDACDFDPEAVRTARTNARQNQVEGKIRLWRQDLMRLPVGTGRAYTVVCANLIADLLLDARERLVCRLQPGGILVIAGILQQEFGRVQKAYETAGLRLLASKTEAEWRSGAFRRQV